MLCLIVFGCQYQCNSLPGKTHLRNDLLCVEWDVKPYTLTHSPVLRSKHSSLPRQGFELPWQSDVIIFAFENRFSLDVSGTARITVSANFRLSQKTLWIPCFMTPFCCIFFNYHFSHISKAISRFSEWYFGFYRVTACNVTHGIAVTTVCPSVCLSNACIVTKLNDGLLMFWHHMKCQSL